MNDKGGRSKRARKPSVKVAEDQETTEVLKKQAQRRKKAQGTGNRRGAYNHHDDDTVASSTTTTRRGTEERNSQYAALTITTRQEAGALVEAAAENSQRKQQHNLSKVGSPPMRQPSQPTDEDEDDERTQSVDSQRRATLETPDSAQIAAALNAIPKRRKTILLDDSSDGDTPTKKPRTVPEPEVEGDTSDGDDVPPVKVTGEQLKEDNPLIFYQIFTQKGKAAAKFSSTTSTILVNLAADGDKSIDSGHRFKVVFDKDGFLDEVDGLIKAASGGKLTRNRSMPVYYNTKAKKEEYDSY